MVRRPRVVRGQSSYNYTRARLTALMRASFAAPRILEPRKLILTATSNISRKFAPTKITRYTVYRDGVIKRRETRLGGMDACCHGENPNNQKAHALYCHSRPCCLHDNILGNVPVDCYGSLPWQHASIHPGLVSLLFYTIPIFPSFQSKDFL